MAHTEYPINDIEVIKFHCPECMKKLSAPVARAGTKAKCSCGAAIQVPEKHLTTFIPRELAQPDPLEEAAPVFEIPKEDKLRIYEEEKLRIIARDMFAGYGKDIAGLKDYLGLAILSLILCPPVGVAALIFSALCRAARKWKDNWGSTWDSPLYWPRTTRSRARAVVIQTKSTRCWPPSRNSAFRSSSPIPMPIPAADR